MRQHPDDYEDLDRYHDQDDEDEDPEEFGTPVYQGTGLSVRALTAEEVQRFLDAHHDQPAQLLGSGWAALDPAGNPLEVPRTHRLRRCRWCRPSRSPAATAARPLRPGAVPAPVRARTGRLGPQPGLAGALAAAAGLIGQVLADRAGLPWAGLVGLVAAALLAWRLRFRPSEQARTWQRGAHGERHTARLLDRLTHDGYVAFHDLAIPGSRANVDHLVIGPTGVFVIDSKQWTGSVHQGADGLAWHNHYRLDRILETVRWEAETFGRLLGTRAHPLLCVHGAHVHGGGMEAQGVAIVPGALLRSALGYDRVLSDADVDLLAATAWTSLRPAA